MTPLCLSQPEARHNCRSALAVQRRVGHSVRVAGNADQSERQCLADRVHRFSGIPVELIYKALTTERAWWLGLQPGEVEPQVLVSEEPRLVVWSSFWPKSPNDTIEIDLAGTESGTELRFRWHSDSPPDERGIAITRQRLNRKLGGNLRAPASEYYWSRHGSEYPRNDA